MNGYRILLLSLLCRSSVAFVGQPGCEADGVTVECVDTPVPDRCTIYMAESTIPGSGLGIFTGVDRKAGDSIGEGDVMIPLTDNWYHLEALGEEMMTRPDWADIDPTYNYVWFGPALGMQCESAHPQAEQYYLSGFAPGLDAAINCNQALINADKTFPQYDYVGLHRSKDPGSGAFSPYHGSKTVALNDVPAGGELFKDYGNTWFTSREQHFGILPSTEDYPRAERMIQKLHGIFAKGKVPEAARMDVWTIMTNLPWEKTRTMLAIPTAYENLDLVAAKGIRAAYQPQATRTLDELERTGRCIDNARPKLSTIRQAGRGAFSTRFLAQGMIVTGTPMLFFPTGDFFKMYEGDWFTKSPDDFHPERLRRYQIMYNYCWHHEKNISSIYMCPYGSLINYINHNQTRANVRLQWAPDGQMNHDASLLQQSPTSMYYSAAPKLWMDVIATRDIKAGEELFMDYGDAWEKAWLAHVEQWERDGKYPADYISAHDWNLQNPRTMLRIEEEQKIEPYPENFRLVCLPEINRKDEMDLTREVAEALWKPSVIGYPCRVIERVDLEDGEYWYRVLYLVLDAPVPLIVDDSEGMWQRSNWIAREAMRFVDAPYSSDLFLDEAFRHPIGFPDDVFPEAWRGFFLQPLPDIEKSTEAPKMDNSDVTGS